MVDFKPCTTDYSNHKQS